MNDSESDNDTIEGEVKVVSTAEWGKTKRDYYYTDYVDKDYPSKLTAKEERLASLEQEEALRIQKKILSSLDNIVDLHATYDEELQDDNEDLIDIIERQNQSITSQAIISGAKNNSRKKVKFSDQRSEEDNSSASEDDVDDDEDIKNEMVPTANRQRRPIDSAIRKNRGLTPYKKKEYRNPRVKHKLKYKKAMKKRRRNIVEAKIEYHRYQGESTGIKTSTIKSIKLC